MMSLKLKDIHRSVDGEWATSPTGGVIQDVSTDSREIGHGDLFVALKGDRFDGHDFVDEVKEKGAKAAIVSRVPEELSEDGEFGLIKVEDTLQALGDLARYYRGIMNATVVAVTGSGGKTTTKDVIAHMLAQKHNVVKAPESYNNHVGVPLSLFQVDPVHDYVVLEIGTNQPGEIDELSGIAQPDIGVLTNISETHLKGLGSVEGVKREKSDLFRHLTGDGFAVYNADNQHVREVMEELGISGHSFGLYHDAEMMASDVQSTLNGVQFTLNGALEVQLPVLGAWNVYNVLAGFLVAKKTGVDLEKAAEALSEFQPPSMRMQMEQVEDITIINDAYNANPRSVQLVMDELDHYEWNGRKIVILGDMAELGAKSEQLHREVGTSLLHKRDLDHVFCVGEQMEFAADEINDGSPEFTLYSSETVEEAADRLLDVIRAGDLLLLKGSRVMQLENVVERLKEDFSEAAVQQS
jgi:UDP-N-acetylmuramoyl-tripeptide--D-alanyl-D-alanine ligase